RDGFGSEFVAVFPSSGKEDINEYILDPLNYSYKNGVNPNIHHARYLAATIVAEPKHAKTIQEIINDPEFVIRVYDPYRTDNINVAGKQYPLAANFSAPYGLWLAE
ncbi:alpha/beta hydrolase, partial [Acinetobacter baumannii]